MPLSKSLSPFITLALAVSAAGPLAAQTPTPRVTGTVKIASAQTLTVADASGQSVEIAIPDAAKVMQIAPGSKDLKSATAITPADIAVGDRVIVTGTAGDTAASLHAARIIVMKSTDIASNHAAEEAAWRTGGGGLVKSVTPSGDILISSGAKTITVHTTAATSFKRYSGDSVKFEDAVGSTLADVHPGDQLRVRGAKTDEGASVQADAIVTGTFRNFSGLLTSIDGTAGTVTLKDLATKQTVTVKVSANSDVRRIPAAMAARFAQHNPESAAAGSPAGRPAAGSTGAPGSASGPRAAGAPGGAAAGASRGAGADLSQMLSRLPTETLGGLKVGDAVMIVATQPAADAAHPSAVTLVAGVEPILQASPKGETTLSPWSMGGGAGAEGGAQ